MLALAEVRDAAVHSRTRVEVDKFVTELGWRDYYVRIHAAIGDGVWDDLEPYKTGEAAAAYATALPDDIAGGTTGAACIDGFVRELDDTGYLHNHARMWFASGGGVLLTPPPRRRRGEQQPLVAVGREHVRAQAVHLQS
jgi:deoxyribodipyrimidine photo-lyase